MSGGTAVGIGSGPCGACKFLRRKCVSGCIFAPYFDSDQGAAHFSAVHKVFGASNVSKLLSSIPVNKRLDAVVTVCYEAQARLRDPVYGCVAHIFDLQQQVVNLQAELSYMHAHLTTLELPPPPPPPPQGQAMSGPMSSLSLDSVALSSSLSYDVVEQLEPAVLQHLSWGSFRQQQQVEPRQHGGSSSQVASAGNELQAFACDLISRNLSENSNFIPKHP